MIKYDVVKLKFYSFPYSILIIIARVIICSMQVSGGRFEKTFLRSVFPNESFLDYQCLRGCGSFLFDLIKIACYIMLCGYAS